MRKSILFTSIAAIAMIPSVASAQTSCERQRSGRVVGTVIGAGVGGVIGNTVAGRGDKTLGTILGAVGGGILGNQIAKPDHDCNRAYGYYDKNNRWHATGVSQSSARGYYNRDGDWVEGAPNGSYDSQNRWIESNNQNNGRFNDQGYYVPASSNGYYDRNDQWVAYNQSAGYDNRNRPNDSYGQYEAPREIRARLAWMDQYIRAGRDDRSINRGEAMRSLKELNAIRATERRMVRNRNGELSVRNENAINLRLDRLSSRLRIAG